MGRVTTRRPVLRLNGAQAVRRPDTLAVEEPLEIRVDGTAVSVTMRTPGDDFDLAAGLLVTEGVVRQVGEIATMRFCADTETLNVVEVLTRTDSGAPAALPTTLARSLPSSSACGVCGKTSIDNVRVKSSYDVAADPMMVPPGVLLTLPDILRSAQTAFDRTGGLHAAGLFTADGRLLCLREDVGRHNAVDKVLGWAYREAQLPLHGHVLMVSGRASFELTQKALMAGLPMLAAVSAPSSLAVDLAADAGLTLIGFLRTASMNVYTATHRVQP
jgi:FdhD protein